MIFNERKLFSHFWGIFLLVGPIFFSSDQAVILQYPTQKVQLLPPVSLALAKLALWIAWALTSIALFRKRIYLLPALLIPLGFINIYHAASISGLIQWICISLGAILFCQLQDIDRKIIVNYLAASCLICSLWIILERFGIEPYSWLGEVKYKHADISGPIGNRGKSGIFVAVTAPFLFRKFKPAVIIPITAAYFISIGGTLTPLLAIGAFLSCWISYLAYCLTRSYTWSALPLMLTAGVGLYLGDIKTELSNRIAQWEAAIDLNTSFLFGNGLGWVHDIFWRITQLGEKFLTLHNDFLELFISMGLTGCLIIGIILTRALWGPFDHSKEDMPFIYSLVALSFSACFWFPMHVPSIATVGLISCSILYRRNTDENFSNNADGDVIFFERPGNASLHF